MKTPFLFIACLLAITSFAQDAAADKIWRTTEVHSKPDLQKGMYTLRMFVADNFKFPEADIKNKKVTVFTSFIIEPDGTMTDRKSFFVSAKDLIPTAAVKIQTEEEKAIETKALNDMKLEAGRVIALFNERWVPATVSGKPVRCLYNYPIVFAME